MAQLRDAVNVVRARLLLDSDALSPGVQLSPPAEPTRKPVPGRLVSRAERLADKVQTWTEQWTQVDASRSRRPQRLRLKAAVTALEERVRALREALGE